MQGGHKSARTNVHKWTNIDKCLLVAIFDHSFYEVGNYATLGSDSKAIAT
jgi:hypothetical protein